RRGAQGGGVGCTLGVRSAAGGCRSRGMRAAGGSFIWQQVLVPYMGNYMAYHMVYLKYGLRVGRSEKPDQYSEAWRFFPACATRFRRSRKSNRIGHSA